MSTRWGSNLTAQDCITFNLDIFHVPTLSELGQANLGQWISGDKSLRNRIKKELDVYTTKINGYRELGLNGEKTYVQPASFLLLTEVKKVYHYESNQLNSKIDVISERPYKATTDHLTITGKSDHALVYKDCPEESLSSGYALAVWEDKAINVLLNEAAYAQVY